MVPGLHKTNNEAGVNGHVQVDKVALRSALETLFNTQNNGKPTRFSGTLDHSSAVTRQALTVSAFTHYAWEASHRAILPSDLEGWSCIMERVSAVSLFDPMLHSSSGDMGHGDQSAAGFKAFLDTHACNMICQSLGLPAPTSDSTSASASPSGHAGGAAANRQQSSPILGNPDEEGEDELEIGDVPLDRISTSQRSFTRAAGAANRRKRKVTQDAPQDEIISPPRKRTAQRGGRGTARGSARGGATSTRR